MNHPIFPRCKTNYPQYISAEGQWFPCCFVSQQSDHSGNDWFFKNRDAFDLKKYSLEEILQGPQLLELERLWREDSGRGAPHWCQVKCRTRHTNTI